MGIRCFDKGTEYPVVTVLCLIGMMLWVTQALAQQHPYEAASSGYFREQDTIPGTLLQYQQRSLWGIGPGGGSIKRTSFNADSHKGVRGYGIKSCASCHEKERYNLHTSRGEISCTQCHRDKPISGVFHYYSAMNPIRRHAYVCAKCHEGATASFATYLVHEPEPLAAETANSFPLFYYAVWFMVILAGGVFVIFIPYVTLWGIREAIELFSKGGADHG